MENQFYVGQRVKCKMYGEGVVYSIATDPDDTYPIACKFDEIICGFTKEGRYVVNEPVSLFPLDPPRIVLTEWQRKKLKEHFLLGYSYASKGQDWYSLAEDNLNYIESILAEPEPPKFVPKEGEAVLVRQNTSVTWNPRVFSKMFEDRYQCYALISTDPCNWNLCRPFDASLVGKVTND